jgi:hypothetical protein
MLLFLRVLSLAAVMASLAPRPMAAAGLHARIVATRSIGAEIIVGRAVCGRTTWLLTETPQLVEVRTPDGGGIVRAVTGLAAGDSVWGLACPSDQELWTLATPHALVRLTLEGRASERIRLALPAFALFAVPNQLVREQLPLVAGESVLVSGAPRQPSAVLWKGLIARASADASDIVARNLVNCGIPFGPVLPCWFTDAAAVSLSDGARATDVPVPVVRAASVDGAVPIHDVAVGGANRLWLLATGPPIAGGRRAAGRVLELDRAGLERGQLELSTPVRLILAATQSACWLLTVRGEIVEVSEQ